MFAGQLGDKMADSCLLQYHPCWQLKHNLESTAKEIRGLDLGLKKSIAGEKSSGKTCLWIAFYKNLEIFRELAFMNSTSGVQINQVPPLTHSTPCLNWDKQDVWYQKKPNHMATSNIKSKPRTCCQPNHTVRFLHAKKFCTCRSHLTVRSAIYCNRAQLLIK